jgi:hypothetical protein
VEGKPSLPKLQALSVCDASPEQAEQEIDNSALLHTFVSKVQIGNRSYG